MPPSKRLNDEELTTQHIAELENNDRVRDFFYGLGYDVDGATDLPHSTVNMDTDDLQQRIRRIRKIANDPDEEIEVILFEVRAVTVALTQTIAQRFRQRAGNYLLILTSDYEILDFVLLERIQTEGRSSASLPKYVIRPRILTVNRRNPGIVAQRVLKRFTVTESDGLYQWDKLRSAYNLAEWSEPEFNNRALFSDYYLKHRLTDRTLNPAWGKDVHREGDEARRLIAGARSKLSGEPEAKTRAELIEPLFALLGFDYKAQRSDGSVSDRPDYALYAPGKPEKPIALALVYRWNRNLDSVDTQVDEKKTDAQRKQEKLDENPGALVVSLLENRDAPPWVILTNGKCWRLYSATASNKITNFYEIDLEEALFAPGHDRESAFKYWWLMFQVEAFTGFLDRVLTESQDYAKKIGDKLKLRIFEKIFGYFAGGFIVYLRDQGMTDAEIDLDRVFHATMTFLYRLMFVLYAESLELVPVKEETGYGMHSLKSMKHEIADTAKGLIDKADDNLYAKYKKNCFDLYKDLKSLFASIDKGDAPINLPVYNGGLFSAESPSGAFLDQAAIPDVYLAIGLDRLARDVDEKTHELVFIDFKSLHTRQLGSIYEGLLEFKLRIADEKLVVIKDGKREIYVPYRQAVKEKRKFDDADVKDKGDVYIANTKQERKATGSYYTPDYIVKYIVEHTVGPVLDEKFKALEPRLRDAQKRYRQHRDTVKARKDSQSPELFWALPDMQQLADDCLNVRVLDPAMGSGHFLVEVVDFTSNRLIDFLNAWSENPVWALLERTRADILSEMERQGVSIDDSKLTRVVLLKRSVLKRCVYGVDLNEMAVELAKVSLWLDAFTLGAPLSFLDHHLKWGNSLIGSVELSDVVAVGSKRWERILDAATKMVDVSNRADATKQDVDSSKTDYVDALAKLEDVKKYANVSTASYFVDELIKYRTSKTKGKTEHNRAMIGRVAQAAYTPTSEDFINTLFEQAQAVARNKRFFHWKLEFPDIFIDLQTKDWTKNAGFDAVVGNPPYANAWDMTDLDTQTRQSIEDLLNQADLLSGHWDIYAAFVLQSTLLMGSHGYHSFIIPDAFAREKYAQALREHVLSDMTIHLLVHFEGFNVFDEVSRHCIIYVVEKSQPTDKSITKILAPTSSNMKLAKSGNLNQIEWLNSEDSQIRMRLALPEVRSLIQKICQNTIKVGQFCYVMVGATVHSKDKVSFIKDTIVTKTTVGNAKRFFDGKNVSRYQIEWDGRYLDYRQDEMYGPRVPELFENPKIIVRDVTGENERLVVTYDDENLYCDHLVTCLVYYENLSNTNVQTSFDGYERISVPYPALLYTTGILAGQLMTWYFREVFATGTLQGSYSHTYPRQIRAFPIHQVAFTTPAERRAKLAAKGRKLYERCLVEGHACVLEFVTHHLGSNETDVIHDLLAFVAQQMIDLNKQKQAEVKRFLGWLENTLHIAPKSDGSTGIDSLTGKTIIQGYIGEYQKGEPETPFEDFFYRLHQNRGRFGVTLSAIQNQIAAEYEKSLAVLLPIKRQLATTDALIDRVVYQLYGLTDEEIKLIEYPQFEQAVTSAREEVLKDKENAADPDKAVEAIAVKVEQAATQYLARVDEKQIAAALRAEMAGWDTLPDHVQKFLITGDLLLQQSALPDYSPIVISFGKAAEAGLNARLFIPFRQTHRWTDCANDLFQKFMKGNKTLSLGSMPIVLSSSAEKALRAFVLARYPGALDTILNPRALLAQLTQDKIDKYRNSAAHDAVLTVDDAKAARQWAVEILGYV